MKKILLLAAISAVVLPGACAGGLFLYVYVGTADSAASADSFLATVARGNIREAYAFTTTSLRQEQEEERFVSMLGVLGAATYEMESWTGRTREYKASVIYRGRVGAQASSAVPFELLMKREDGEWLVESFTGPGRRGLGPGAWFRQPPSIPELTALASKTMREFNRALRKGDFDEFYTTIWPPRPPFSVHELELTYEEFLNGSIDLSGVQSVDPVFTEAPKLEPNSDLGFLLVATGRFPVEGAGVPFRFRYAYVHPEWKLTRIYVGRPGNPDFLTP